MPISMRLLRKSPLTKKTNILQESMDEEINETVSSLDENDDEESEEQAKEERIDHPCVTPSMQLYLPRVEAWLRGITALKAMSQVR